LTLAALADLQLRFLSFSLFLMMHGDDQGEVFVYSSSLHFGYWSWERPIRSPLHSIFESFHPIDLFDGGGHSTSIQPFFSSLSDLPQSSPRVVYVALDVSDNSFRTWSQETAMVMPQSNRERELPASATFDEVISPEIRNHDQHVWLDFALFDAEKDAKLHLSLARVQLSEASQSLNPIFVFGNYLFDRLAPDSPSFTSFSNQFSSRSLTADAFTILAQHEEETHCDRGELYETLFSLRSSCSLSQNDQESPSLHSSTEIKNCTHEWTHHRIAEVSSSHQPEEERPGSGAAAIRYYHHDTFDHLLTSLASQLLPLGSMSSTFTLPIGGLRCLERMRQWSSQNILISFLADKAYHRSLLPPPSLPSLD
jgi:hypothetical protein